MKIISVDDEPLAIKGLQKIVLQEEPGAEFVGFAAPEEAFRYLAENRVDVAFLDIELGAYSGIELAKRCKELCPGINIIFVTGYSQYVMDAFRLHASGYLMKPVRASELRIELDNLRCPVLPPTAQRVRVQTFGNFEVFVDDIPLKLPLVKCRECLAYLVDRKGALVTVAELAGVLWEDKPFTSAVRNSAHQVVSNLMKALKEAGVEDIIIKHPRVLGIDPAKIDCDYYRVLSGDVGQLNLFTGEYMANYSWAEFTAGDLAVRKAEI